MDKKTNSGIGIIGVCLAILLVILLISIGCYVQTKSSKQFEEKCNELYGIDNWYVDYFSPCGYSMSECYTCFLLEENHTFKIKEVNKNESKSN